MAKLRKTFSAEFLYKLAHQKFQKITEPRRKRVCNFSLADCFMSGLAIFSLKYPSLLQFDQGRTEDKALKHNLRALYGVEQVPCDTQIRERLDPIDPIQIRKLFKAIFAQLQRGKVLEQYQYLNKAYLVTAHSL